MPTLYYLTECTSTNDEILQFLSENTSSLTSIYTFCQTKGRGTYGNQWESMKNKNIAFSCAIPTHLFTDDMYIMLWCTLMARDFLTKISEKNVEIKWPNDLILGNKKISGMLIEKRKIQTSHYYIFGIGINVLQEDFSHFPQAGSLFTQTRKQFDLHHLATEFHHYLARNISLIPSKEKLLDVYNAELFRKGKISVFEINNKRQNGIIQMMDTNGNLIVELENDGLQSFYHKEIKMLY